MYLSKTPTVLHNGHYNILENPKQLSMTNALDRAILFYNFLQLMKMAGKIGPFK